MQKNIKRCSENEKNATFLTFLLFRFCIERIHCPCRAYRCDVLDALDNAFCQSRNLLLLLLGQVSKNKVYLSAAGEIVTDSCPYPYPLVTFQRPGNVFQPVVTAR